MRRKISMMAVVILLLAFMGYFSALAFSQEVDTDSIKVPKVLFLIWEYTGKIDPVLKAKIEGAGYYVEEAQMNSSITLDYLEQFNVVIIPYFPHSSPVSTPEGMRNFTTNVDNLKTYVKQGGGLLLFSDFIYRSSRVLTEYLLKDLGAEVIEEGVRDENPANQHKQRGMMRMVFNSTTNITPHPLTEGIKKIWYASKDGTVAQPVCTYTMNVDDNWTILVRGEKSARSVQDMSPGDPDYMHVAYPSEPPIFAVRQFGKGRVALFTTWAVMWATSPYHKRFNNGYCLETDDGFKFLTNTYDWLAQPTVEAGLSYTLTLPASLDNFEVLLDVSDKPVRPMSKGIAGVKTTYSGGKYTIKQFCDKAKSLGYNFVIFTEDYKVDKTKEPDYPMSEETTQRFQNIIDDCAKESTDDFLAVPGLKTVNNYNVHGLVVPLDMANDGNLDRMLRTGFMGNGWAYFVTLANPSTNPWTPWQQKFYNGFAVYTYKDGELVDSALEDYLDLVASTYAPFSPMVDHKITELEQLDDQEGKYQIYLPVQTKNLKQRFHASSIPSFISNGPVIYDFSQHIASRKTYYEKWSEGNIEDINYISIDVSSEAPITDVIVYKGRETLRHYKPDAKRFSIKTVLIYDWKRPLAMIVKDADGRTAVSGRLEGNYYPTGCSNMCTDKQNTIEWWAEPDKDSEQLKMEMIYGMMTRTAGWEGNMYQFSCTVPATEFAPANANTEMTPWSLSTIGTDPVFFVDDDMEYVLPKVELPFLSKDVIIQENNYIYHSDVESSLYSHNPYMYWYNWDAMDVMNQPSRNVRSRVRRIIFRPEMYSFHMMKIDSRTEVLRDITLVDRDGLEVVLVNPSGPNQEGNKPMTDENLYPNYVYIDPQGQKVKGKTLFTEDKVTVSQAAFDPTGYVAMYPATFGAPALFAFDPNGMKDYEITIGGTHLPASYWRQAIGMGYDWPNKELKKGTVLEDSFLLALDAGEWHNQQGIYDESGFDKIRDLYGFDGTPAYTVTMSRGKLLDDTYCVTMQAEGYLASGAISQANLPNPLGLIVENLNSNWTNVIYDNARHKIVRTIGTFEDTAYATIDVSGGCDISVGAAFVCDNPDVRITFIRDFYGFADFVVHNPLEREVSTTITSPLWPNVHVDVTLQSGQAKAIRTTIK